MNERILEYAEQARLYAKSVVPHSIDDPVGWNYEYHKKFAELIVRECANVAAKNQAEDMNWDISEIIKEHFGVEECEVH